MRYRKKPLEIEAWRYGEEATPEWGHVAFESGVLRLTPDGEAKVRTLEGSMTARKGDYIVKGIKGELYPVKPDIFEATYGSVDAQKDWRAAVTEANDLLNDVIGLEAAGDMEVPEYPFARILCAADELGSVEDWMTAETGDEQPPRSVGAAARAALPLRHRDAQGDLRELLGGAHRRGGNAALRRPVASGTARPQADAPARLRRAGSGVGRAARLRVHGRSVRDDPVRGRAERLRPRAVQREAAARPAPTEGGGALPWRDAEGEERGMTGWKARGTGTCPVCGRTFAKNSRNQKYCGPECKAEQDKRAARRRRADEREG